MLKNSQQTTVRCNGCSNDTLPQDGEEVVIDYHGNEAFFCKDCVYKTTFNCESCNRLASKPMNNAVGYESWCDICVTEYATQCYNCNSYINKENINEVNGQSWCEECMSDLDYCENHDGFVDFSINVQVSHVFDENWCEECANSGTFECEECKRTYKQNIFEEFFIVDTMRSICEYCYQNNDFFKCSECGQYFSYDMFKDDNKCKNCMPVDISNIDNIEDENADVLEDSYGLRYDSEIFTNTTKPYIGVEFETFLDTDDEVIINEVNDIVRFDGKFGILKKDGSLNNQGFEIVSVPMLLEDQKENWSNLFNSYSINSFKNDDYGAGIHIHLNRNSLSDIGLARLLFLIYGKKDNTFFTRVIAERPPSGFWDYSKKIIYKNKKFKESGKKFEALNISKSNTVEFRMFNSTNNKENFNKNLEYVDAAYNFCNNETFIIPKWENFVKYIKENKEKYPNLFSFLFNRYITEDEKGNFELKYNNLAYSLLDYTNTLFRHSSFETKNVFYKKSTNNKIIFCTEDGLNWWTSSQDKTELLCGEIPHGKNFNFIPIEKLNS